MSIDRSIDLVSAMTPRGFEMLYFEVMPVFSSNALESVLHHWQLSRVRAEVRVEQR
jgi:hypothetical protein